MTGYNRKKSLISCLMAATLLAGCTMIPKIETPSFSAAKTWDDLPGYDVPLNPQLATQMSWQEFFNSAELEFVINTALANNKDIKLAALNIEEARALYRIQRADLLPHVDGNALATIGETSDKGSTTGQAQKTDLYQVNVGIAAYEPDFFGKIRSLNESALNDYMATQEAHAVVRNILIAEVANAYLQLLTDQKLLSLTKKTLDAQKQTYDLLVKTLEYGATTEQDVARAQTAVDSAVVNMYKYKRQVMQDKNALFLLMGVPQDSVTLPDTTLDNLQIVNSVDPGLPAEVLVMRPDIRQAEFQLLSANADIGAARAAFFPSISLTGSYGFASRDLDELFSGGAAGAWGFVPQITVPIFKAGQNKANLEVSEIRKDKAVVAYEQAIQTAFREVADELAARATLDKQLQAQRRLVAAGQNVYDKTFARYQSGIDSFLSVLDAQRELYSYQQNEILTQQQYLSNLVNLYKALGGQ